MEDRIQEELRLLRTRFPKFEYVPEGRWVRLPNYPLPAGWSRAATDVAFQIPAQFPGSPPYGFHVPAGLKFNGKQPNNYTEPSSTPFAETWGMFSWTPDGVWTATSNPLQGANLVNWALGFSQRFREGV
jgi:hypothetical protein